MKKERKRKLIPINSSISVEKEYRNKLYGIALKLRKDTLEIIIPILKSLESEYVRDAYAKTLEEAFNRLRANFINTDKYAQIIASSFVSNSDTVNRQRFYKSIENAIGVNVESIVSKEGLEDVLVSATRENVSLIKSIPEEYFKQIEGIVYRGTTRGLKASSMISEIQKLNKSTVSRAKLIARDQSSKINSVINQTRQENLGIEEYIWRTSEDGRVRPTHAANNGKIFRWDDPPKETGHPGQDIQCRCVAQPIIKI